jgi:ribonuclease P protein subunit RPR2
MIPPRWKRIAQERIQILLRLAKDEALVHPQRSQRYVELAQKISRKYKVRIPLKRKRSFCSECNVFWRPGSNVSVRLDSKKHTVVYMCGVCKAEKRYPYATKRAK